MTRFKEWLAERPEKHDEAKITALADEFAKRRATGKVRETLTSGNTPCPAPFR
jgi:hypothetical protein